MSFMALVGLVFTCLFLLFLALHAARLLLDAVTAVCNALVRRRRRAARDLHLYVIPEDDGGQPE